MATKFFGGDTFHISYITNLKQKKRNKMTRQFVTNEPPTTFLEAHAENQTIV